MPLLGLHEHRVPTGTRPVDRAVTAGRLIERMWEWLTAGDPESQDVESAMAERCALAGGLWI